MTSRIAKTNIEDDEGPEVALRKLSLQFGVLGYVVLNKTGIPVKHYGMDMTRAIQYAGLISELVNTSTKQFVRETYGGLPTPSALYTPGYARPEENEIVTIRLRTRKHEIIIVPGQSPAMLSGMVTMQMPNQQAPPKDKEDEVYTLVVIQDPNYVEPPVVSQAEAVNEEKD